MVTKVDWPTSYSRRDKVYTCPGSPVQPTYELLYDEKGKRDLQEVGKINTYEMIQSHRSSCDLHVLLERYKNGDVAAVELLNRKQPMYGDFTDSPGTLAEYYQRIAQAENDFARLPVDVRAKFNFSASEYFASIGSKYWADSLGIQPIVKEDLKEEVKDE